MLKSIGTPTLLCKVLTTALACFSITSYAATGTPASTPQFKHLTTANDVSAASNSLDYQLMPKEPRWRNHVFSYHYNPKNQPDGLNIETVLDTIHRAAAKWSDVCNIAHQYNDITDATFNSSNNPDDFDEINSISWLNGSESNSRVSVNYRFYRADNDYYIVDADIALKMTATHLPGSAGYIDEFEGLMTEMMGYVIGINVSDNPQSILHRDPPHLYKRTLRGDDVNACIELYGPSALSNINRIFNWAEVAFPELFSPPGRLTEQAFGFNYRYFENTVSAVGEQNGIIYVVLPGGGRIIPVGTVGDFLAQAVAQGF